MLLFASGLQTASLKSVRLTYSTPHSEGSSFRCAQGAAAWLHSWAASVHRSPRQLVLSLESAQRNLISALASPEFEATSLSPPCAVFSWHANYREMRGVAIAASSAVCLHPGGQGSHRLGCWRMLAHSSAFSMVVSTFS